VTASLSFLLPLVPSNLEHTFLSLSLSDLVNRICIKSPSFPCLPTPTGYKTKPPHPSALIPSLLGYRSLLTSPPQAPPSAIPSTAPSPGRFRLRFLPWRARLGPLSIPVSFFCEIML
jgi:hypothetical protein